MNLVILPYVNGQLLYLVAEAFRGWKQHRTVIFPSLVTIFLCTILLSASITALTGTFRVFGLRSTFYQMEAFLVQEPDSSEQAALHERLMSLIPVSSVLYVSPEEALKDFEQQFPGKMLDLVRGNPLPASYRIEMLASHQNLSSVERLQEQLQHWSEFDVVQTPVQWIRRLEQWQFDLVFWPLVISSLLLITLGLVIGNAVRLTLYSRRLLVENMKYAGGSSFFIQFPFVLEGMMQGLVGSLLGVALWMLGLWTFLDYFPALQPLLMGTNWVLFFLVFLSTVIGGYASLRAVRQFLFQQG